MVGLAFMLDLVLSLRISAVKTGNRRKPCFVNFYFEYSLLSSCC